jgi:hypothetical protein
MSRNKCSNKFCEKDKICNPASGRCVLKTGKIGRELNTVQRDILYKFRSGSKKKSHITECSNKICDNNKVCNPASVRCVLKTGSIGKKITKKLPIRKRSLIRQRSPVIERLSIRESPIRPSTFWEYLNSPSRRQQSPIRSQSSVKQLSPIRQESSIRQRSPIRPSTFWEYSNSPSIRQQSPIKSQSSVRQLSPRQRSPIRQQSTIRPRSPIRQDSQANVFVEDEINEYSHSDSDSDLNSSSDSNFYSESDNSISEQSREQSSEQSREQSREQSPIRQELIRRQLPMIQQSPMKQELMPITQELVQQEALQNNFIQFLRQTFAIPFNQILTKQTISKINIENNNPKLLALQGIAITSELNNLDEKNEQDNEYIENIADDVSEILKEDLLDNIECDPREDLGSIFIDLKKINRVATGKLIKDIDKYINEIKLHVVELSNEITKYELSRETVLAIKKNLEDHLGDICDILKNLPKRLRNTRKPIETLEDINEERNFLKEEFDIFKEFYENLKIEIIEEGKLKKDITNNNIKQKTGFVINVSYYTNFLSRYTYYLWIIGYLLSYEVYNYVYLPAEITDVLSFLVRISGAICTVYGSTSVSTYLTNKVIDMFGVLTYSFFQKLGFEDRSNKYTDLLDPLTKSYGLAHATFQGFTAAMVIFTNSFVQHLMRLVCQTIIIIGFPNSGTPILPEIALLGTRLLASGENSVSFIIGLFQNTSVFIKFIIRIIGMTINGIQAASIPFLSLSIPTITNNSLAVISLIGNKTSRSITTVSNLTKNMGTTAISNMKYYLVGNNSNERVINTIFDPVENELRNQGTLSTFQQVKQVVIKGKTALRTILFILITIALFVNLLR